MSWLPVTTKFQRPLPMFVQMLCKTQMRSSISNILWPPPPSFRDLRTRGARSADQVDQMSPESNEDYRAGRVTNGVMRN
ncbi:hypothetical protein Pyn_22436 [Prunus yedoensis var. nudiflora]|uniref:Uncharacterized protein n=1 Tax=Prunus yedoensis var. nudiflora TaxID=2094558 RepID=A0A314Z7F4_PRUYE|nr:hypothetical protein Pyn_22436 [Prunus yedoensis var. nudiflora]